MTSRRCRANFMEPLERRRLLASSWYVATTGNDGNTGAIASPFLTVAKAVAVAVSGDTINLRAGTYNGKVVINKSNITLQGYASEAAKISTPITDPTIEVTLDLGTEATGCTIRNLEITGGYVDA